MLTYWPWHLLSMWPWACQLTSPRLFSQLQNGNRNTYLVEWLWVYMGYISLFNSYLLSTYCMPGCEWGVNSGCRWWGRIGNTQDSFQPKIYILIYGKGGIYIYVLSHSVVSNSCDPINCTLPGSSVRGIFQARILEYLAISFSRGSSWSRYQTCVSCIGRQRFYL